jgi:hypothetical protein
LTKSFFNSKQSNTFTLELKITVMPRVKLTRIQKRDRELRERFPAFSKASAPFHKFLISDYRVDREVYGVYLFQIRFEESGEWGLCIWNDDLGYFAEEPASYGEYDTTQEEIESKYQFQH